MGSGRGVHRCTGTNRSGERCRNLVSEPDSWCGSCRGPSENPFALPTTLLEAPATPTAIPEFTSARLLQTRLSSVQVSDKKREELAAMIDFAQMLSASSRAESTKATYHRHWKTFQTFREYFELGTELPARVEDVELFISHLGLRGNLRDDGRPLSPTYIEQAVHAIGRYHVTEGLASPTDSPTVKELLNGYARKYATGPRHQATPIRIPELTRIILELPTHSPLALRNFAITLLACHPNIRLTLRQIADLNAEHLQELEDGSIALFFQKRSGGRFHELRISPSQSQLICPVRALGRAIDHSHGPAFLGTHERLSRNGVAKAISATLVAASISRKADSRGLPVLTESEMARLGAIALEPKFASLRTAAVLLTGFWGAMRGDEVAKLTWNDLEFADRGIRWRIVKSKTDQYGRGRVVALPAADDPFLCPVAAIRAYSVAVARRIGREPAGSDQVFISLHRNPAPISKDSLRRLVSDAAKAAGLPGKTYSMHSLRAGFVTEAFAHGASELSIVRHGGWANASSVEPYFRSLSDLSENNPAVKIIHHVGQSAPSGPPPLPPGPSR